MSTIEDVLKRVIDVDLSGFKMEKEIIVVNDGSTDKSGDILKTVCKDMNRQDNKQINGSYNIKVIHHEKNKGKGAAIRTGFNSITGDIVIIQDADLELTTKEIPLLLLPIIEGKTSVVFGSRFRRKVQGMYLSTLIANKIFTFFTNLLYGAHITDVMTCYKVMSADVVKMLRLRSDKFDIEPELAAKICKTGYKIYEDPISYNPRKFKSGKKIGFLDSFPVLWALIKYRFID